MTIAFINSWTDVTQSLTHAITVALSANDYCVAFGVGDASTGTYTFPAGFSDAQLTTCTADAQALASASKKITGTTTSLTTTSSDASSIAGFVGFSGVDTTTPLDVATVVATPINTAAGSPWTIQASITTVTSGCMIVAIMGSDTTTSVDAVHTFADNVSGAWTTTADINSGFDNAAVGYSTQASAGTITVTATGTAAGASAGRNLILMALRPAAGAGAIVGSATSTASSTGYLTTASIVVLAGDAKATATSIGNLYKKQTSLGLRLNSAWSFRNVGKPNLLWQRQGYGDLDNTDETVWTDFYGLTRSIPPTVVQGVARATALATNSLSTQIQLAGNAVAAATATARTTVETVNTFRALTTPVVDNTEWSTGESKGIYDNVTGDLLLIRHVVADNKVALIGSQDNGASWTSLASDVSNPNGGSQWPNRIESVVQDSNGKIHAIAWTKDGSSRYTYLRFALTRSGGHVTGFSLEQDSILFPSHSFDNSSNPRGAVYNFKLAGVETLVFIYEGASSGTTNTNNVYVSYANSLTPSTTANFIGIDGTGNDTLIYSTTGTAIRNNHQTQIGLAQIGSTEDMYLFLGQVNADYQGANTYSADYDLDAYKISRSGAVWSSTLGSAILISSIAVGGGTQPMFLDCQGTSTKAWAMYYDPAFGVSFCNIDSSGTFTNRAITSPDSTAGKAAFGVFNVDDSGNIWEGHNLYGVFSGTSTPTTGKLGFWNGSTWSLTTDSTAKIGACFFDIAGWKNGVLVGRVNGDTLGTITGIDVATIYTSVLPAAFVSTARGTALATNALTTAISLAGTARGIAFPTNALTTTIKLQGPMTAAASMFGLLGLPSNIITNTYATASMTGQLSTSVVLQSASYAVSSQFGGVTTTIAISVSARASASMAAPLVTSIALSGNGFNVATMLAAITSGSNSLQASMVSSAQSSGALTTGITMQGAMSGTVKMTAGFGASLFGSMSALATATGSLSTGIRLSSGMFASALSTAPLSTGIALASNQNVVALMIGSMIAAPKQFNAAMLAQPAMRGVLATGIPLSAVQRAFASFTSTLNAQTPATFGPSPGLLFMPLVMDIPIVECPIKFAGETFVLGVDFSQLLPTGITLSGTPTVVITESGLEPPITNALAVFGNPVLDTSSTMAIVPLTAGQSGMWYVVDISCTSTDSRIVPAIRLRIPVL